MCNWYIPTLQITRSRWHSANSVSTSAKPARRTDQEYTACLHAYRAGRSTDTALYHLKSLIEDSLTHKEVALCAVLDIQGAFDNTSHEAVNASLARKGLGATASDPADG